MKLVVCESVSAIAKHLRVDDGRPMKLSGGLKPSEVFLCHPKKPDLGGWDTRIPPPNSPTDARQQTKTGRLGVDTFCPACVEAWERMLADQSTKG